MFDYNDYLRHAEKYRHYCTAEIATNIVTHNGEGDLSAGEIVGVKFRCVARNQLRKRDEPVYTITLQDGRVWGDLYASALAWFVL